mmetsp:Transcript_8679/g.36164  ORF Transcript_8679/g.36164 Transcript_8679/m.36164 type:complete len:1406 (+) Transcript_8679:84-4301(+)
MASKQGSTDNVSVAVRVRPLNSRELEHQAESAWLMEDQTITQQNAKGRPIGTRYTFDHLFGPGCNTRSIYDDVAHDIIASAMEGFNGTIFAYGQTSSGKTHTMEGDKKSPGIIPLAVRDIFTYIKNCPDREFLLRVSYMEIYNENIRDLLQPGSGHLKIHEAAKSGVFVAGLTEEIVATPEQVFQVLNEGHKHRTVASNKVNEHSSRSHSIFRMVIESRERSNDAENKSENANKGSRRSSVAAGKERRKSTRTSLEGGAVKVSLLNLVDLAGSERVAYTSAEGKRLKEGCHINKSLLNLGNVIQKLSKGPSARRHIPYRSSKLTRILEPALGGNSRTAIVCTVTPASMHLDETHSTLKFANRAKMIQNTPVTNEVLDDKAMIRQYQKRMQDLEEFKRRVDEDKMSMNKQLEEKDRLHAEQQERIARLEKVASMVLNSQSLSGVDFDDFGFAGSLDQQPGASFAKAARQRRKHRETWCPGDQSALLEFQATSASAVAAPAADFAPLTQVGNVQANEGEMKELREKNEALQQEVQNLTEALSLQKKEQRMEFCDKNAEFQQELSDLQEQLENQELQTEELQQLLREAKQELAQKEEAADELQEAMLMEADTMQAELQEVQEKLQESESAREAAVTDVQAMTASLEEQQQFSNICLKKLEESASAAEELQQQHGEEKQRLEQELTASLATGAEVRASVVELETTKAELEEQVDALRKELETKEQQVRAKEERVLHLQEAVAARDVELAQQAAVSTLQEADIATLQTLNGELEEAKAALEEQVGQLRVDLEYEQKISSELDSAAQDLKLAYEADIDQLQKQLQNKAMARRSSMSRGALAAAVGATGMEGDRREVERVKKDCERLQEREKQLLQSKSKLEQDKAQMDRELKKTKQQFQTIEKENEKLRQSYQKQKDIQQQLTAAEKQVAKLTKAAQRQTQLHGDQAAELNANVAQLGKEVEALTETASTLKEKLEKSGAALEEESARTAALQAELTAAGEKHSVQLSTAMKQLEEEREESEKKIQELQATVAELERNVEEMTRERTELSKRVADMEKKEEDTRALLEQQSQQIDQQERSIQSLVDSGESKTQMHLTDVRMLQQTLAEKEKELKGVLEELTDSQFRLEEQQSAWEAQINEVKQEKEKQRAAAETEMANLRACLEKQQNEAERKQTEHKKQMEELMGSLGDEKHELLASHEALKEEHRKVVAEQEKLQEQAMEVAVRLELAEEKAKDLTLEHETQRLQWSSTEAKLRAELEDSVQERAELIEEHQEDVKKQEHLHSEVVAEMESELDDVYSQLKEKAESNACLVEENTRWAERLQECDREWKAKRKQYFSMMKEKNREWEKHKVTLQDHIEQLRLQLLQLQKDKDELKARQELRAAKRADVAPIAVFTPFSPIGDENSANAD